MIKEIFLSTLTGAIAGGIFVLLKLPVPAPPVFPAVMGIVGIWLGADLIQRIF